MVIFNKSQRVTISPIRSHHKSLGRCLNAPNEVVPADRRESNVFPGCLFDDFPYFSICFLHHFPGFRFCWMGMFDDNFSVISRFPTALSMSGVAIQETHGSQSDKTCSTWPYLATSNARVIFQVASRRHHFSEVFEIKQVKPGKIVRHG